MSSGSRILLATTPTTARRRPRMDVAAVALAALVGGAGLAACASDDSGSAADAADAAAPSASDGSGEKPDAPIEDLLIADDAVPGIPFTPGMDQKAMQGIMGAMDSDILKAEVQPAECADAFDVTDRKVPTTKFALFDNDSKIATVLISEEPEQAKKVAEQRAKCPSITAKTDAGEFAKQSAQEAMGGEVPPEVLDQLGPDFGKQTVEMNYSEIGTAAPDGVGDYHVYKNEGQETTMGQTYPTADITVIGVVDGIFVATSSSSAAIPDPTTGEPAKEVQPADMDAFQQKAEEVFRVQAEKIRNA